MRTRLNIRSVRVMPKAEAQHQMIIKVKEDPESLMHLNRDVCDVP